MKPSQARSLSKYPLSALSIALFSILGMTQIAFADPPTEEEFKALKQEVEQLQQQLKYFTSQQKNGEGDTPDAKGGASIAVGANAKTEGLFGIAVGSNANASGNQAQAYGACGIWY